MVNNLCGNFQANLFFSPFQAGVFQKDSATETTEAMVKPLQETLGGRSEFRVSVVCNEGATGGPNSGMGDALNKLKREDKPGPSDEGDVNEADDVAQETQGQDFDVADLVDDLEAVKVGGHFRDVIENGGDAKERGGNKRRLTGLR